MRSRFRVPIGLSLGLTLALSGMAVAHDEPFDDGVTVSGKSVHGEAHHQHGGTAGHLAPTSDNVTLIGQVTLGDAAEGKIADVAVWGGYAYLGSFFQNSCTNPENIEDGGVWIVDIRDPADPVEVGFIPAHQDTYVGEGVQVIPVSTSKFNGDLLVQNNETCDTNGKGGVSLFDVTNPLKPARLVENFGDFNTKLSSVGNDANDIHSAFAWDAGAKAYVVMVDDLEGTDVDILDITDPRHPKLIAEYDVDEDFPIGTQSGLDEIFFHDVVVKQIGGHWVMLLSYWDGGYVQLNVDNPAAATYLADSDFAAADPQRAEHGAPGIAPEGNAHQAEFSLDNRYVVAADEDFTPFGLIDNAIVVDGIPYFAVEAGWTTPIANLSGGALDGTVVWTGGLGCTAADIPPAPSPTSIALIQRGVCFFQDKAEAAEARGYAAFIVASDAARPDDVFAMGARDSGPYPDIAGVMVSYATGEALKAASPRVLHAESEFNGWGYVHLFDRASMAELDTYAISEAQNPAFAAGFGDLSVHEVAMSHVDARLGYLSYYAGGFRVIRIVDDEIVEIGRYVADGSVTGHPGNNFWGVQVFSHNGHEYVAASDRDSGLWIFEYTPD
jgi:hypothetical protein